MIPRNITRIHILRAIADLQPAKVPKRKQATRFVLITNGKALPTKLVETGKPFKRSHVLEAAGLSAGFYDRNPVQKERVETIIAKLNGLEPPIVPEPPGAEPEPESESTQVQPGALVPIAGLSWNVLQAEAQRWQQEQERLTGEIRRLELQLDEAIDNAHAYERILALHRLP